MSYRLIVSLCVLVFGFVRVAFTEQLQHADIALAIYPGIQSQFYPVRMNAGEQPYLELNLLLRQWMGLRVECQPERLLCKVYIPPNGVVGLIDGKHQRCLYGHNEMKLLSNDVYQNGDALWLSYTALARCLPIGVTWNLQQYRLSLTPQFDLPDEIKKKHALALSSEKIERQKQAAIDAAPVIWPQDAYSVESRYRFDWALDQQAHSQLGITSETNLDLLKGTLYFVGNKGYDLSPSATDPFYWNYSVTKPGTVHLLRIGHTENVNSLLLPYMTLKRSIEFEKLPPAQGGGGGFQFVGRTMPATEVDVLRNGVLLSTQIAGNDGSYTISAPSTVQGDIFTIRLYYRDGTHSERTIVISDDYGLILASQQWDVQAVSGEIDQTSTPRFSHLAVRYGVLNQLTVGAHALSLPESSASNSAAGMIDVAWRPRTWMDVIAETLRYNAGTDYSAESNITYFNKHNIRLRINHIAANSPLVYMRDVTLPNIQLSQIYNSDRSWSIQDIYSFDTWRFASQYVNDIAGQMVHEMITGVLNEKWSMTASSGYTWQKQDGVRNDFFTLATLDFRVTQRQLIEFSRLWQSGTVGQNYVMYRLQGNGGTQWDANIACDLPDQGSINVVGTVSWRSKKHWMLSLSFDNQSINAVLSFQGIFGDGAQYRRYEDFGSGSVEGYVYQPTIDDSKASRPLSGVRVSVAGQTAVTDKQGHYFIAGVPPNQRELLQIDRQSLDPRFILEDKPEVVEVRSGTIVHYNPVLLWTGGLDGYVQSDKALPAGSKIVAESLSADHKLTEATVESDGFFVFNRLPVGHYTLRLQTSTHEDDQLSKEVDIPSDSDWLSAVSFDIDQLQLAQKQRGTHA